MKRKMLEDLSLMEEEFARRRSDDPLHAWQPHGSQQAFIHSVFYGPAYENWLLCANRFGKSDAVAWCAATLARFGLPGAEGPPKERATSGWIISRDFPSSRDIMQPKIFDNHKVPPGQSHPPFIPDREIEHWYADDYILKLKNGSLLGFKSIESSAKKFPGVGRDWILFDEEPTPQIYEETTIRVEAGRRLRIFGAATLLPPEDQVGGVSWMFEAMIDPFLEGRLPGVRLFSGSIYDNPHLDPEEIKRLESKYPPGTPEHDIRLLGKWLPGLTGARAYPNFDATLHVKPQPPMSTARPLSWLWDFNVTPMITLLAQREGDLFRVYRELVLDEGNVAQMVDRFRAVVPAHPHAIWIYGDATGDRRDVQTGRTDYQIMLTLMRQYSSSVSLKVPDSNPLITARINAVQMALKDEEGVSHVEIDPSCRELIADLKGVLRDKDGGIKKTSNRRDPYFRRTHASEAFGDWIAFERPVVGYHPRRETVEVPSATYAFHAGNGRRAW